jgi:DNA primase
MSQVVELIKEKLSIADVVGQYVELKRAGKYFKARSPFSNERTPSFYVSPDRGLYHCFSTGKGGDIFTFVQEMEGVDFKGALKVLADRAGIQLVPEDPAKRDRRDRMFEIAEAATVFFTSQLERNADAKAYLARRGMKEETIKEWRLGYAPEGWSVLRDHLSKVMRTTDAELMAVGLAIDGQRGAYDRFRSRIMFPISDSSGRVVGFSGRAFGKEAEERGPKYMNSPEGELFDKSSVLYGFDKAKQTIHRVGYGVLVEGQMDLVMSHQAGVKNTVASSGTALTEGQLQLIKRIAPRLMVAYDSDKAGVSAAERACLLASSVGFDVKVVKVVGGKDPADLVAEDPGLWKKALTTSMPIIDYKLAVIVETEKDERMRVRRVEKEVVPYIAAIDGTLERAHAAKRIASAIGSSEEEVLEQVKATKQGRSVPVTRAGSVVTVNNEKVAVENLLAIGEWLSESAHEPIRTEIGIDKDAIQARLESVIGPEKLAQVRAGITDMGQALAFRAGELYQDAGAQDIKRGIEDLFASLEYLSIDRKYQELKKILGSPPVENEETLLNELQALAKKKDELQASVRNPRA